MTWGDVGRNGRALLQISWLLVADAPAGLPSACHVAPSLSRKTSANTAEQKMQLDLDRRDFFNRFIC